MAAHPRGPAALTGRRDGPGPAAAEHRHDRVPAPESRDLLCWDTRDPGPDAWPVVYLDEEEEVFPGTLTELLVAEMTGTGPDLADFELGDPEEWAWPFWGPDRPRSR